MKKACMLVLIVCVFFDLLGCGTSSHVKALRNKPYAELTDKDIEELAKDERGIKMDGVPSRLFFTPFALFADSMCLFLGGYTYDLWTNKSDIKGRIKWYKEKRFEAQKEEKIKREVQAKAPIVQQQMVSLSEIDKKALEKQLGNELKEFITNVWEREAQDICTTMVYNLYPGVNDYIKIDLPTNPYENDSCSRREILFIAYIHKKYGFSKEVLYACKSIPCLQHIHTLEEFQKWHGQKCSRLSRLCSDAREQIEEVLDARERKKMKQDMENVQIEYDPVLGFVSRKKFVPTSEWKLERMEREEAFRDSKDRLREDTADCLCYDRRQFRCE